MIFRYIYSSMRPLGAGGKEVGGGGEGGKDFNIAPFLKDQVYSRCNSISYPTEGKCQRPSREERNLRLSAID